MPSFEPDVTNAWIVPSESLVAAFAGAERSVVRVDVAEATAAAGVVVPTARSPTIVMTPIENEAAATRWKTTRPRRGRAGATWNADEMRSERGPFVDILYGVAYPLLSVDIDPARAVAIREDVAAYCIRQAELNKPYNLNFFDSDTEGSFYCSQLAYRVYLRNGIDLNTGASVWSIFGTEKIILPQEIWDGCVHEKAGGR